MRFRKILASTLAFTFVFSNFVPARAADANWKTAYGEWLLAQTPLPSSAVMLSDLDFDGIPELFWGKTDIGYSQLSSA